MIEHIWSVLCTTSMVNSQTNNISLIEVTEKISIPEPPAEMQSADRIVIPVSLDFVSLWGRSDLGEPARQKAQMRFLAPDGMELASLRYDIDLTSYVRYRSQTKLPTMTVHGAGKYQFIVEIEASEDHWDVVARIPLELEIISQQPASS